MTVILDVFDNTGQTKLGTLSRRTDVGWRHELDGPGSGQVSVQAAHAHEAGLINYRRIVKVWYDGAYRFAWRIDRIRRENVADAAGDVIQASGAGIKSILVDAWVAGRGNTIGTTTSEERVFSWASDVGAWYNSGEWVTPVGKTIAQMAAARGGSFPAEFPSANAQWIWPTDPSVACAVDTVYFRGSFTLASDTNIRVSASADETLELYVDGGQVIAHDATYEWRQTHTWDAFLPAGTHIIAARVVNTARPPGTNLAGLIVAVHALNSVGEPGTEITYSNTSWVCRADSQNGGIAPGWRQASIFKTLITEAQSRSVTALSGLTFGFTDTTDSESQSWVDRQGRVFRVASDTVLSAVEALGEGCFDWDISPAYVVDAWISRGQDRTTGSNAVILRKGLNAESGSTDGVGSIVNTAAILTPDGWVLSNDSGSQSTYGRVEGGLQSGTIDQASDAGLLATQLFAERAQPQETVALGMRPVGAKDRPYIDYGLGDNVRVYLGSSWSSKRVIAFSFAEDGAGLLSHDVETGLRPRDPQERVLRWLQQAARGFAAGTLASASPVGSTGRSEAVVRGGAGGGVVAPGTSVVDILGDVVAPGAPTGLSLITWLTSNPAFGRVKATWTAPALDGDGGSLDDLRDYIVSWRQVGDTTYASSTSFSTSEDLPVFPTGMQVEVVVRARDVRGNVSPPTATQTITVASDTTAPGIPSTPTVTVRLGVAVVAWDGKDSGGTLMLTNSPDLRNVEVHIGTTSGFTPSTSTLMGNISVSKGGTFVVSGLPYSATRFAKFVAYDMSGNASAASAASSSFTVTPLVNTDLIGAVVAASNVLFNARDLGSIQTYYQTTQPASGMLAGDLWYDTDDGFKPYRYSGSAWQVVQDGDIATAQSSADAAQTTADGKNTVHYATTAPAGSGHEVNDLWFETDAENKPYFWNGSSWAAATFGNAAIANLDAGKITTGFLSAARLQAGTINADRLVANSITAAQMAALSIAAGAIQANAVTSAKIDAGAVTAAKLESLLVIANTLNIGPTSGQRITLDSTGIHMFDPDGDIASEFNNAGTGNYANFGAGLAVISDTGGISGTAGSFVNDVEVMGELLVGDFADAAIQNESNAVGLLDRLPRGSVAFGAVQTGATTTTETGLLELAFEAVAGRMYRINIADCLVTQTQDQDTVGFRIRNGGANSPDMTDPIIGYCYAVKSSTTQFECLRFSKTFRCNISGSKANGGELDAGVNRILIDLYASGGGTAGVFNDAANRVECTVEDIGIDTPNTGIGNTGSGGTALKRTYVTVWDATWSGSYNGSGNPEAFMGDAVAQGFYDSTNGIQKGMIGFPSLTSTLSGSTVKKVEVYLYAYYWWYSSGGMGIINTHGQTNEPATFSSSDYFESPNWPRPGGRWVTLPSSWHAGFVSGTRKGIAVGGQLANQGHTWHGRYTGVGGANPPKLRITYVK